MDLLDPHLGPHTHVLDVGCGHGEFSLWMARQVASVVGVERDEGYVQLATELLEESGVTNTTFLRAELAGPDDAHPGGSLPLPDQSVDLVVDRRGPTLDRFVDDLFRVARPGTPVLGMHPTGGVPPPPWAEELPALRQRFGSLSFDEVASWVTRPLEARGFKDYRLWWIDVPEFLDSPRALYDRLAAWSFRIGDAGTPAWEEVRNEVERVFSSNQRDGSLVVRHVRLVWTFTLPA